MKHPASFRDPAGFIFEHNGRILRQVNNAGQAQYDLLISSGLYSDLVEQQLLIPHREVPPHGMPVYPDRYRVLEPERIQTISYPYEWSFSQLQDAAVATLKIQMIALGRGMVLKDASAYNIQFHQGRPILIDTLSFEQYTPSQPWKAYRQFCQHFLAPLALMSRVDVSLNKLLAIHIDGVPLPLASRLLPKRTHLSPGLLVHLLLHARAQGGRGSGRKYSPTKLSRHNLEALIDSLIRTTKSLHWTPKGTEWGEYYSFTNYSDEAFEHKKQIIRNIVDRLKPKSVWDLGGNTGEFSRIASANEISTVCFDIDPVAVEKNYRLSKARQDKHQLPLLLDLTNPSPSLGWANRERSSLSARGPIDVVLALALIHHLAISNNLPFEIIASYFSTLGNHLVIEFIPKDDSKVQILLSTRTDIFPSYHQLEFEKAFSMYFEIVDKVAVKGSKRTIYLMKSRSESAGR